MVRFIVLLVALGTAQSAAAASKNPFSLEFYSLANTDFVVALGFLCFLGLLAYTGVQKIIFSALDERAGRIRSELEEARKLKEDAQKLLGSFQRKQKDVEKHAQRIVEAAREDAQQAAEQAKADIARSVERRMAAAQEKIAAAQAAVMKDVREQAITVATEAARTVFVKQMTAQKANGLIDQSISSIDDKIH